MAGTAGVTTGIDTQLLVKYTNSVTTSSYATATATATGFDITANGDFFSGVSEIGSHGRTGNTGTYYVYGEGAQRSYAAQATRTDFTFTYTEDRSNSDHVALLNKSIGDDIAIGVFTKVGTGESIAVMVGEISELNRETPVDSPATVTVGVAVSEGPTLLDKA